MTFTPMQAKAYTTLSASLRRASRQAQKAARDLAAVVLSARPTKVEAELHDAYMAAADRLSDMTLGI